MRGRAAEAPAGAGFELATMNGHAFQCLVSDADVRDSLAAVRNALRPGGRFVFETRHPQARAWEGWRRANPDDVVELTDPAGRPLRVWHDVDAVEGELVAFHGTTADPDGTVLRVDRAVLRFLGVDGLNGFCAEAGLTVEAQYGNWDRTPVDGESREIITVARRE